MAFAVSGAVISHYSCHNSECHAEDRSLSLFQTLTLTLYSMLFWRQRVCAVARPTGHPGAWLRAAPEPMVQLASTLRSQWRQETRSYFARVGEIHSLGR